MGSLASPALSHHIVGGPDRIRELEFNFRIISPHTLCTTISQLALLNYWLQNRESSRQPQPHYSLAHVIVLHWNSLFHLTIQERDNKSTKPPGKNWSMTSWAQSDYLKSFMLDSLCSERGYCYNNSHVRKLEWLSLEFTVFITINLEGWWVSVSGLKALYLYTCRISIILCITFTATYSRLNCYTVLRLYHLPYPQLFLSTVPQCYSLV